MSGVGQRGESIDDAETIEGAREIVRGRLPGRHDVDETRADLSPSGHIRRNDPGIGHRHGDAPRGHFAVRARKCRSAKSRKAFQSAGTAMCPPL